MRNEAGCRCITCGILLAFHDGLQRGRQFLAELDAPLVEGIDAEKLRLDEDAMLVERDQPAERIGI